MKRCYIAALTALVLGSAPPAVAQYMFVDTNGDGVCDGTDVLFSSVTSLDVYLVTDENADGSPVACPTGEDLTMGSYSFILRRDAGGTAQLAYGAWTDNLGFTTGLTDEGARMEGGDDLWIGLGGGTLPPGKHKLGSLAVNVAGMPFLGIVSSSALSGHASTSFASACPAAGGNNTMRLGVDFFDVCATGFVSAVSETTWGKIKAAYR